MRINIILLCLILLNASTINAKAIPVQGKTINQKKIVLKSKKHIQKNNSFLIKDRLSKMAIIRPQQPFAKTLSHFVQTPKDETLWKNAYIWEDTAPIHFDELIISWNAKRPIQGHITFWTSVKCGSTWSPWHRMATWGATTQRSFINKLHHYVHTKHVRVELQRNHSATAFRVKAVFHDGATIDDLHAIFACFSYQNHFKPTRSYAHYPSYVIKGIPKISQMRLKHERNFDLCAPTSLSMVTSHFNKKLLTSPLKNRTDMHRYALDFAHNARDHGIDIFGNWQLNAAQAYNACKGTVFFRVERLNSFDTIYQHLKRDIPVIVSVRRLQGGATPYAQGHILVVIGWNQKNMSVICLDPAFKNKVTREYPLSHFSRAWALSKNLSYIALPIDLIKEIDFCKNSQNNTLEAKTSESNK